jgi:hypothetical protein
MAASSGAGALRGAAASRPETPLPVGGRELRKGRDVGFLMLPLRRKKATAGASVKRLPARISAL